MRKSLVLLFFILLCALAVHLFDLDGVPPGITNDEVNIGYDAYSMLKTGKDQWASFLPIYFKGFGDYRLPVYTYSAIPAIAIFGLSSWGVRIPSVVFSLLAITTTFLLSKILFDKRSANISAFFIAFAPWFIGMTRLAIESPLGVLLMILGTIFFIRSQRRNAYIILSGILFVLSMYTYYSHRLILPIYILALIIIYSKKLFAFPKKILITSSLIMTVLILPMVISGSTDTGQARIKQVIFTTDVGVINRINEQRGACLQRLNQYACRIIHNRLVDFSRVFFRNYLAHFSLASTFVQAEDTALSVIPPGPLLLGMELPFFLYGFYLLIKQKKPSSFICLTWFFLAPIPDSMTGLGHYSRAFIIFPIFQVISGYGVSTVLSIFKYKRFFFFFKLVIVTIVMTDFFSFSTKYFGSYSILFSKRSHYEYRPLFDKLFLLEPSYRAIYLSRHTYDTKQYIFYLFYKHYDPTLYQQNVDIEKRQTADGWVEVTRIGKWHFVESLPMSKMVPENSLIVGAASEFLGKQILPIDKTYNLDGSEAFYFARTCTGEEIAKLQVSNLENKTLFLHCYY